VDKPAGATSNAVLQRVRRLYAARKAGHTGSLDPLATGMLPVCFGEATKFAGHLLDADKHYRVRLQFGARTDTADADGKVVERHPVTAVDPVQLAALLPAFEGDILQVPPMYSALKQGGRRLYELARAGEERPRPPRPVAIRWLRLVEPDPTRPVLEAACSKGTYIRSLVEDIARAAGTVAHVVELRRIAVQPFEPAGMRTPELLEAGTAADLAAALLPVDAGLRDWPAISLDAAQSQRLLAGQTLGPDRPEPPGLYRLYGPAGDFLGVGNLGADQTLKARRLRACSTG
jgi:tRNA pseudouridine55 synthase